MANPSGRQSSLPLLLTTSIGCAMALVDTNIVAIAIPSIASHFGMDSVTAQWVVSAFFLCFAAALLPAGAIADRYGRRRTVLFGLSGLALASLLSGLATTVMSLLLARALQGVMIAFVLPPSLAIIGHRFHEPQDRNRAWAIWGGIMGIAMVITPVTGGLIVEQLGWRWAFFINVPICVTLAVAAFIFADESRDPTRGRLDPAGIFLFTAAMFALTSGLINGQSLGWTNPVVQASFAAGVMAMAGFIFAEKIQKVPMINLGLFKSPSFIGAVWAMFAYAATAQVMASLFPIFLQNGRGLSATATGVAMLPFASAMLLFPYVGARLGRHLSSPGILTIGLSVVAVGNGLAAASIFSGNWAFFMPSLFFIGSGAGLLNGETQKAIMITIARDQTGVASGISTTARFSGILIGFAVLNAVAAASLSMGGSREGSGGLSQSTTSNSAFATSLFVAAVFGIVSAMLVWTLMRKTSGTSR